MACSAESFYVDADVNYEDWGTMDGCYEDSGTRADLPLYFINGVIEDETFAVWASESHDTTIPVS